MTGEFVVVVLTLLIAGVLLVAWPAQAQQLPPSGLPSTIEPGQVQERLERRPQPSIPSIQLPESGEGAEIPESVKAIKVTLRAITIEGASAVPVAQLQVRANRYVGHEISGAEIFELAHELTTIYRNAGYILSRVIVPPQTIADGHLVLRAVEGYIANVHVEGDPAVAKSLAAIGEKIKASRPLQEKDLERYLILANSLPGTSVRSVLSPSQVTGAADLTLVATVKKAAGFLSIDDYGSKYLGPGQTTIGVVGSQLLGINDQLQVVGVGANQSEMSSGQVSYSQILTATGLKISANLSHTHTEPGDILSPFEIRGSADDASLALSYPFLQIRNQSLVGRVTYETRNVDSVVLGTPLSDDKIRALRFGMTYMVLDSFNGSNTLTTELSRGLGGTGPTDPLRSRSDADGTFTKATFDYERLQPLGGNYGITVGLGGQWAGSPLLTSEEFALGGRHFGRAYDPAELVGDEALAVRAEPAYFGSTSWGWLPTYQAYSFYDLGAVWDKGPPSRGVSNDQSLASAGFGVRLSLEKNITADLELAWPLTKPIASFQANDENSRSGRLLGSLVARF
jgi:hemolysin activation/secretion protein